MMVKSVQHVWVRIRFGLQTLVRLYAIRKAYGVYPWSLHAVLAVCGLVLFSLLGISLSFTKGEVPGPGASLTKEGLYVSGKRTAEKDLTPADSQALAVPAKTIPFSFVVDKARKTMMVYRNTGAGWGLIRTYLIVTGERPGQKRTEGDLRTPEGLYWVVGERFEEELDTTMYGHHAYVLNYPNRFDVAAGRSGSGIWIHGTSRPISRGCVAMLKQELSEMAEFAFTGTPVYIAKEAGHHDFASFVAWDSLLSERDSALHSRVRREEELVEFARKWKKAWEATELSGYRACYSPSRFFSRGMAFQQWMDYKAALFEKQRGRIQISLANYEIPSLDSSEGKIRFRQTYQSPTQLSRSRKELSLTRGETGWSIMQERVLPRKQEQP